MSVHLSSCMFDSCNSWQLNRLLNLVLYFVAFTTVTIANAQDKEWTNVMGGDFFEASNWDSGVPGPDDDARFNLDSAFDIELTSGGSIAAWHHRVGKVNLFGGNSLDVQNILIEAGELSVDGPGTGLVSTGPLQISGGTLAATLNVTNGGNVSTSGANIGIAGGASGTISVVGSGSTWNSNSGLVYVDNGTLRIDNGGSVSNQLVFVGTTDGAGQAFVSGSDSEWQFGSLNVGATGIGSLRIDDGASAIGSGFIGRFGTGTATVSGAGSLWDNRSTGDIQVGWGSGGTGILTIEDGGRIEGRAGAIGSNIASTGHVTVTGEGSSWTTSLQLLIGTSGNGSLLIEDGGTVLNRSATLAATNRGTGNVTVSGSGSSWQVENVLRLSSFGDGNLTIRDGGLVTVGLNGFDGLTVVGETSKIELAGGRLEFGTMSIESLSRICGTSGSLAGTTESITGYNHIDTLAFEDLRSIDTSEVRIANAGVVHGTGVTRLGIDNQPDGEIRVLKTDFMRVEGHSFNSGEINNFGGVIQFGKTLTNRSDGFISGRGQFSTEQGLLNEGVMAFTAGITEILGDVELREGGQVITSGSGVTTFFDDVIHNGDEIRTAAGSRTIFLGELSGNGAFTGEGELLVTGDLRPGNSPGVIQIDGDLTMTDSAASFFEIGGNLEGEFDKLIVDGNLHLDGLFSVDLIGGFLPSDGADFVIAEVNGLLTGQFSGLRQGDRVARVNNMEFRISYSAGDGNDVGLNAVAIPEPGSCGILLLAMAMLSTRRRKAF